MRHKEARTSAVSFHRPSTEVLPLKVLKPETEYGVPLPSKLPFGNGVGILSQVPFSVFLFRSVPQNRWVSEDGPSAGVWLTAVSSLNEFRYVLGQSQFGTLVFVWKAKIFSSSRTANLLPALFPRKRDSIKQKESPLPPPRLQCIIRAPGKMSTATTLTYQDVQVILAQWKAGDGPTPEEQATFQENAIKELNDPEKVQEFQANVEKVGVWANEVDASFGKVTRGLKDMVERYGSKFPELAGFRDEWNGYNARWVAQLSLSRDVASEQVTVLRRFDQVFLDMVESIVTEQDREDVIIELQSFIDEDHGRSDAMSQGFYDLRRDIKDYLKRFDEYVEEKGEELEAQAELLRQEIARLQDTIENLGWEIAAAIIALLASMAGAATIVGLLGVAAATATLIVLLAQRLEAELKLMQAQQDLAEVNALQEALAHIKTDFDGLKPDIALICDRLKLFGDIWQNVRSDAERFQTHLKKGLDAANDATFKREIRLARSVCAPMQAGLERYAQQLENRRQEKLKA